MTNETEFRVGDRVMYAGCEGIITATHSPEHTYPICAKFDDDLEGFTSDGKLYPWHKEPLLTLLSRPKKKRKVELRAAIIKCPESGNYYNSHCLWEHMEAAKHYNKDTIALSQHAEILEIEED